MERDDAGATPDTGSQGLSPHQVARIFGSLEPAGLVRGFQAVCAEILGPAEIRVFTFVSDDRSLVLAFGEEAEPKAMRGPHRASSWGEAIPLEGSGEEQGDAWRAFIPLNAGGEEVGVLQITRERSLGVPPRASVESLASALAVALANSLIFEKTRRLTFTDDLTALYNSRFMSLYLDRELKRCRRTRAALSLLFMDLDGFKNVNDTHGHLAGSRTLVEVGLVLEKTVRDADVLIRYGGDEFVILFPETPLSGGLIIAERIRQVIGSTRFLESQQIEARVSASIGIAAYPESADDVRGLISSADRAMYQAKALGKNRVIAASPLRPPESPKRP